MQGQWRERFEGRYVDQYPDWAGGAEDQFGLRLIRAQLRGGETLDIAASGVTAIVGANNVGKSTLLRELVNQLAHDPQVGHNAESLIVDSVQLERVGTPADMFAWLGAHCDLRPIGNSDLGFSRMGLAPVHPLTAYGMWQEGLTGLGSLSTFLVHYADGTSRLRMTEGVEMRDDIAAVPGHPLHSLEDDPALLLALVAISEEVFGQHLELDHLARVLRLRVGQLSVEPPPVNAINPEYRAAVAALPWLEHQGDGMKSLLGLVLPLLTSTFPIVVIDEPEAFLHPPQAHALGRILGRIAKERAIQVVLSTHDKNLLAGLLDSQAGVSVARLTRTGNQAHVAQLDPEALQGLWTDPVLKHTNVLEGLFGSAPGLVDT